MLRFLSISTFAEFESLIGIFNVLGVVTGSFSLFLIKEIVKHKNKHSAAKLIFLQWGKWFLALGIIAYLIYLLFLPLTLHILQIENWLPVALVGSILVISFIGTPAGTVIQALGKFKFVAINNVIAALMRLGFWWIFILMGTSLTYSILGFLSASCIGVIVTIGYAWYILKNIPPADQSTEKQIQRDLKQEIPNLFQFFLLSVLLAVMMNMDIILATYFLDKEIAGAYAAISVLAKFIVFIIGAIDMVYYPKITWETDAKILQKNIFQAGALICISIILGILGAWILGPMLLHILKPWLESYSPLLLNLITAFGIYAAIVFFTKILVARKDYKSNIVLFISTAIFVLPVIFHLGSGITFYTNLLIVSMVTGIIGVGIFTIKKR